MKLLLIRATDYPVTVRFDSLLTNGIFEYSGIVYGPIHVHDQMTFHARKIDNEAVNCVLTPEFDATYAPVTHHFPNKVFLRS